MGVSLSKSNLSEKIARDNILPEAYNTAKYCLQRVLYHVSIKK